MKRALVVAALLMCAAGVHAQTGVPETITILGPTGGLKAGAKVTVCGFPATGGVPCTNTMSLFSDINLSVPLANPLTSDSFGTVTFFVSPPTNSTLTYTVTGAGTASPQGPYNLQAPSRSAGTPGGSNTQLQFNSSASFAGATGITTPDGASLAIQGPDPLVDVTAPTFGARLFAPGGDPQGVWATCNTNTTVNLTTINFGLTFINGDGIEIDGCGPTPTMATPSAPTVTPETVDGGTGTEFGTSIPAAMVGASTYLYKVVARDQFGGMTAASGATTITTGQSTLGLITYNISTITRSNDTLTVTTTANNLVNVGSPSASSTTMRLSVGTGADQMSGFYNACTRSSATVFTICNTPVDTRVQGWTAGDTFNQTSGTVDIYSANHIHITAVSGAWEYLVCAERPGDSSYHLIGTSKPQGVSNNYQDIDFYDYGSPFMDKQVYPRNAVATGDVLDTSNAICNAASATPQMYSGTVTAGGGTTTLTVTPATSQTTGSPSFTAVDATPGVLAAMKWANFTSSLGVRTAITLIPGTQRTMTFFYPLIVPANTTVEQVAYVSSYEAINLRGNTTWDGFQGAASAPVGGTMADASVQPLTTEPMFYLRSTANTISHLSFQNNMANGGLGIVSDDSTPANFEHIQFGGGVATDYLSMNVLLRETTGTISQQKFYDVAFNGGPDQVTDKSWTPLLWVAPGQAGAGPGTGTNAIELNMKKSSFYRRGIAVTNSNWSNGPFFPDIDDLYRQGGIAWLYMLQLPSATQFTRLHAIGQDTEGNNLVACLAINGSCGNFDISMVTLSTNNPMFGGVRPNSVRIFQVNGGGGGADYQLPNRGASIENSNTMVTSPFQTSGSYLTASQPLDTIFEPVHIPTGEAFYNDISQATSVAGTAAGGGSIPTGNWYYCITPVGFDFGEGICSLPSNQVTTASGGNQTVNLTWTNPLGSQSSNIYRCSAGASCLNDGSVAANGNWSRVALHQTGASYSDTAASGTAQAPPQATGTGVSMMNKSEGVAPQYVFPETTTPTCVAGFDQVFGIATEHRLNFCNNAGSALVAAANPDTTLGDLTYGGTVAGGVATETRLAGPTTPNGVAQSLTSTPSGGVATAPVWAPLGVPTNAQTGVSYTVLVTDRASYLSFSNAGAIAVTLPQAGTAGFGNNFVFVACAIGAGTATITPTTSTISFSTGAAYTAAAASMALTTGQCAWIYSDNTNYFAIRR